MDEIFETIIGMLFVIFLISLIGILIAISVNLDTIANIEATEKCQEKGFETYIKYDRTFFSSRAKGIVCGNLIERQIEDGKIIAYDVKGDNGNLIIGELNNKEE